MTDRRRPTAEAVYVVRYVRIGNRDDVRQRYFNRRHDAVTYAAKLRDFGRRPRIYRAAVEWTEVTS